MDRRYVQLDLGLLLNLFMLEIIKLVLIQEAIALSLDSPGLANNFH